MANEFLERLGLALGSLGQGAIDLDAFRTQQRGVVSRQNQQQFENDNALTRLGISQGNATRADKVFEFQQQRELTRTLEGMAPTTPRPLTESQVKGKFLQNNPQTLKNLFNAVINQKNRSNDPNKPLSPTESRQRATDFRKVETSRLQNKAIDVLGEATSPQTVAEGFQTKLLPSSNKQSFQRLFDVTPDSLRSSALPDSLFSILDSARNISQTPVGVIERQQLGGGASGGGQLTPNEEAELQQLLNDLLGNQ